jgi:MFS family permease
MVSSFLIKLSCHSFISVILTVRSWFTLGDRIGRKRAMLAWAVVMVVTQPFPMFIYVHNSASLYWILATALFDEASGSVLTLMSLIHTYAADVTSPDDRTVVFGRIMATWYIGLGVG